MATVKIRTRYQRMTLAVRAAQQLREHGDPKVQELAQVIEYALSAPISTLNNVLECFPRSMRYAIAEVNECPNVGEHATYKLRQARRKGKTRAQMLSWIKAALDDELAILREDGAAVTAEFVECVVMMKAV